MSKIKKIPKFKSILQEKKFWQTHDSTEYINWNHAKHAAFPNLKPSTKTISLRLPESLLNEIRMLANKEDIPYQSLMKMLLAQGVHSLMAKFRS
jgi:predicted DNA binding CopG/RHH family protein